MGGLPWIWTTMQLLPREWEKENFTGTQTVRMSQFTRSSGTREKSTGARKSKNVQVGVERTGPLKPTSTTDSK